MCKPVFEIQIQSNEDDVFVPTDNSQMVQIWNVQKSLHMPYSSS